MSLKEKLQAVAGLIASVEKQFGQGAIMRLSPDIKDSSQQVISSGSIGLDRALGIGGYPRGRVVEIFGPESAGKSTLALHAVHSCQKQGGIAAYIDAEHALDTTYATALGVEVSDLLLSQPDCGEQALEIVDLLARSQAVDLIVVDSVAALVPQAELEGAMGDQHVGLQARLMSRALRKIVGIVQRCGVTVIFINQLRQKIGVMFGNPETTTGGHALKFYSSVRLDIRRAGPIKAGDQIKGNRVRVKVVKNKMAAPFQKVEFDVLYGVGICHLSELLDMGLETGIVEKSGAWLRYEGESLGQGRDKARDFLRENEAIRQEIYDKVMLALNGEDDVQEDPEETSTPSTSTTNTKSTKSSKKSRRAKNTSSKTKQQAVA
ncbi:MAG: recombinase RecA [Deltaproteobacteria bacterium]|nr:recombinase RecA [Deltaproteobacteria bacterium]MBU49881.1 recombinase RecA [Deltaproteobacteria bacterium]|tara:strand:- start:2923 stop:4053 length:1131 start_codon:yes stop_codon:yes gene_type:complete